jgi:hypothetical protein
VLLLVGAQRAQLVEHRHAGLLRLSSRRIVATSGNPYKRNYSWEMLGIFDMDQARLA